MKPGRALSWVLPLLMVLLVPEEARSNLRSTQGAEAKAAPSGIASAASGAALKEIGGMRITNVPSRPQDIPDEYRKLLLSQPPAEQASTPECQAQGKPGTGSASEASSGEKPGCASQPGQTSQPGERLTEEEREALWGRDSLAPPRLDCKATPAPAPCAAQGVASLNAVGQLPVAEGNPVNPLTGQKYQVELDEAALPGPLGLEIRRHYNSGLTAVDHPLGRGWVFSYDTRLFLTRTTVQIIQADGHRLIFRRPLEDGGQSAMPSARGVQGVGKDGSSRRATASGASRGPSGAVRHSPGVPMPDKDEAALCSSERPEDGIVRLLPEGGYRWEWPNGRWLDFDRQGYLVQIREPKEGPKDGRRAEPAFFTLQIQRDAQGRMQQVTDPAGRTMRFDYDRNGHLRHIDHPGGRWTYRRSAQGQLLLATAPGGARRRYRYEDAGFPFALTAIEGEAPALRRSVRMGTWRYDHQGRVIEYQGPKQQLRFAYHPADAQGIHQTVVTDSQGRIKTYRFRDAGGTWQVLSITGQDCAHCEEADRYFRYDARGRLVGMRRQLDAAQGSLLSVFRIEHDRQGRIARVWQRGWRVDSELRDQPPEPEARLMLFRRYEYADDRSRLPSLVARPSVEPGKEYTVRYQYRLIAGQERPVRITEGGYTHGQWIERSVTIDYDAQGRVSRLDGPLPGELDRIEVRRVADERAARPEARAAGGVAAPAGGVLRPDAVPGADGGVNRGERSGVEGIDASKPARFVLVDGLGREVHVAQQAPRGWLASSLAWLQDNGSFHRQAGMLHHRAGNGAEQQVVFDDFGRITQTRSPDAGVETFWHDAADRVIRQTDATGAEVRIDYDDFGRPLDRLVLGADGWQERTQYRYQGAQLVEVQHPVATERYAHDAQGRVVMRAATIHPPGSGREQRFVTRFGYTGDGLLPVQVILPNGAIVARQLDAQRHTVHLLNQSSRQVPSLLYRRELWGARQGDGSRVERWQFGNRTERQLHWRPDGKLLALQDRAVKVVDPDSRRLARAALKGATPGALEDGTKGDGSGAPSTAADWPTTVLSAERLHYRPDGRIEAIHSPGRLQRFAYNTGGQLIIAEDQALGTQVGEAGPADAPAAWWYAYDDNGNRLFTGWYRAGEHPSARMDAAVEGRKDEEPDVHGSHAPVAPGSNRYRDQPYDAAGRLLRWQGWTIDWHPGGQIVRMRHEDGRQLRYFHNHRGERVAREENGQWSFFDYYEGKLQAEQSPVHPQMRAWWYEGEIPVVVIEGTGEAQVPDAGARQTKGRWFAGWLGGREKPLYRLFWLHLDHLGLPLAMSDEHGRQVWQQQYGPFGERHPSAPKVGNRAADPRLRFPGQWIDHSTGLHYNLMRDYDPSSGRYLSPDPLGLRAGPNPYLYVGGDPLRHVDPSGLLLFAFDGTFNDAGAQTNVWKFAQLYRAGGNGASPWEGHRAYLAGVGVMGGPNTAYRTQSNEGTALGEGISAEHWKENIEYHVQQFRMAVNNLRPGETLNIDVVGFSRGAAQALEFGRLIARELRSGQLANAQQVNLRFMGLLDPVATNMYELERNRGPYELARDRGAGNQTSLPQRADLSWETACNPMGVDAEWKSVLNIIAAHDQRDAFFNTGSLGSQLVRHGEAAAREEFALAGAHSDIGGGYADGGDLSDVALWALIERAQAAGVQLVEPRAEWQRADNPLLHIEWTPLVDGSMDGREVLVDGQWKSAAASGVRGMEVVHTDIWPDRKPAQAYEHGGLARLNGEAIPMSEPANMQMGAAGPANFPPLGGVLSANVLSGKPFASLPVDMQKYCAYLLGQKFLQKCPY